MLFVYTQVLEGEVVAVESFGMLINLGEGIRALCTNMHLSDVTVKRPKNRFKVIYNKHDTIPLLTATM
jgi:ribosomal protein S1